MDAPSHSDWAQERSSEAGTWALLVSETWLQIFITWSGSTKGKQVFLLFIILLMVVLNFESVDEIVKCDHSSESY